jgi:hypothetical protein
MGATTRVAEVEVDLVDLGLRGLQGGGGRAAFDATSSASFWPMALRSASGMSALFAIGLSFARWRVTSACAA